MAIVNGVKIEVDPTHVASYFKRYEHVFWGQLKEGVLGLPTNPTMWNPQHRASLRRLATVFAWGMFRTWSDSAKRTFVVYLCAKLQIELAKNPSANVRLILDHASIDATFKTFPKYRPVLGFLLTLGLLIRALAILVVATHQTYSQNVIANAPPPKPITARPTNQPCAPNA